MLANRRAVLLSKKDDVLEIYHNPLGSLTFDPIITTSQATTVIWQTEAGTTVTTGTSHALSYTPTAGPKVCKVTVGGGLQLVTRIEVANDALTGFKNLRALSNLSRFTGYTNQNLVMSINDIPRSALVVDFSSGPSWGVSGSFDGFINTTMLYVSQTNTYGSISKLPATLQYCYLYGIPGIVAESIAHLVKIINLRIYDFSWDVTGMDLVIDSIYQNREKFVTTPTLYILSGNAAPSGTYAPPPVDESSNSDWDWCVGVGHHWPLTGNAKRWYLVNGPDRGTADAFNRWSIT